MNFKTSENPKKKFGLKHKQNKKPIFFKEIQQLRLSTITKLMSIYMYIYIYIYIYKPRQYSNNQECPAAYHLLHHCPKCYSYLRNIPFLHLYMLTCDL